MFSQALMQEIVAVLRKLPWEVSNDLLVKIEAEYQALQKAAAAKVEPTAAVVSDSKAG